MSKSALYLAWQWTRGVLHRWKYFVSHAKIEISRRKSHYILGFLSCMIVVLAAAVVQTVLANAPAIFLRQAEGSGGQVDFQFKSSSEAAYAAKPMLNYTRMNSILSSASPDYTYTSPRLGFYVEGMSDSTCGQPIQTDKTFLYGTTVTRTCNHFPINFWLIDTAKEARMGLGRNWDHPAIPSGSVYLSSSAAQDLNVKEGDTILLRVFAGDFLLAIASTVGSAAYTAAMASPVVAMPVTVNIIYGSAAGKFKDGYNKVVMMEQNAFANYFSQWLHPNLVTVGMTPAVQSTSVVDYSTEVLMNFPPNRVNYYLSTNYDDLQRTVTSFANEVVELLGFYSVSLHYPILDPLNGLKYGALFLGLILDIIVVILFILSTILVYSLLMISVETRTFELGIMRMVGLNRKGLVQLIIIQALTFVLPAWAVGLLAAVGVNAFIAKIFTNFTSIQLDMHLTSGAITFATVLGLLIPILASIVPIIAALGQNLHDSLDTNRSKTKAVAFSLNRSSGGSFPVAMLTAGALMAVIGFLIYYLVPLALISLNVALFLNIFFAVLVGMLLGLVLLALNVEHLVEKLVARILFCWESSAIMNIVLKNLTAHRLRNRKTTIMYSLALAFIIFLTVAYDMQIRSVIFQTLQQKGALVHLSSGDSAVGLPVSRLESTLENLRAQNLVASYSWISFELDTGKPSYITKAELSNIGKVYSYSQQVVGVSPNLMSTALPGYLKVADSDASTGLSLLDQLYTARGSQSAILGSLYKSNLDLSLDPTSNFLLKGSGPQGVVLQDRMRPLAFLDAAPAFSFSQYPSVGNQNVLVSLSSMARMGKYKSVLEVPMKRLLVKLVDDNNKAGYDLVVLLLNQVISGVDSASLWDFRDYAESYEQTDAIMSMVFTIMSLIAVFLCFFSLVSSMAANIMEQTKEMSMLRSIGMRRIRLTSVYVYEALILVLAAAILGITIGSIVGWTMIAQRTLFTQLPVGFQFPTQIVVVVLLLSLFFAVLSSFGPAWKLVRKPIAELARILN
eukprot:GILK01004422.1.p1 GENE.GILK01004422.1~~GILK01004422.1.p1  ORF type:complete len:1015 (+),score=201.79 GILK01004422.1:200-3244(+)